MDFDKMSAAELRSQMEAKRSRNDLDMAKVREDMLDEFRRDPRGFMDAIDAAKLAAHLSDGRAFAAFTLAAKSRVRGMLFNAANIGIGQMIEWLAEDAMQDIEAHEKH